MYITVEFHRAISVPLPHVCPHQTFSFLNDTLLEDALWKELMSQLLFAFCGHTQNVCLYPACALSGWALNPEAVRVAVAGTVSPAIQVHACLARAERVWLQAL